MPVSQLAMVSLAERARVCDEIGPMPKAKAKTKTKNEAEEKGYQTCQQTSRSKDG